MGFLGVCKKIGTGFICIFRTCSAAAWRVSGALRGDERNSKRLFCHDSFNKEGRHEIPFRTFWKEWERGAVEAAYSEYRNLERHYEHTAPKALEQSELSKIRKESGISRLRILELADGTEGSLEDPISKRICYVLHNSFPFSSGGYATRTHGMVKGLQEVGYEVICVTRPGFPVDTKPNVKSEEVVVDETIEGVRYIRLLSPTRKIVKLTADGRQVEDYLMSVDDYLTAAAEVLEIKFRRLMPALIVAASNYLTALPALVAARRVGIPFIYEIRGFWEITRMSRNPDYSSTIQFKIERMMEAGVAARADHVFTLTKALKDEIVDRGVPVSRITVLPNSCDISAFHPRRLDSALASKYGIPPGVPVIGYVGTFVDYEGLEDLASACGLLKKRGLEFRLLLVGSEDVSGSGKGYISAEIHRVATSFGFSEWLILPGRVPHNEVSKFYSLVDIAAFPRKPWLVCEMVSPIKVLEAMAMEKAILASNVRGLSEIVAAEETGLLFEKGDIADLTMQLMRLISDSRLRNRLGFQARRWVIQERTWVVTGAKAGSILQRSIVGHDAFRLARTGR